MRLEQLRYLEALARYKSMNAASQKLFVSPQAISLAMKQLEEELGIVVLERSPQGVTLTPAGEIVLRKSSIIIRALEELNVEIAALKTPQQTDTAELEGEITIVVNSFFYTQENLSAALLRFKKANSKVTLKIVEKDPYDTIAYLADTPCTETKVHLGIINTMFYADKLPEDMTFYPICQYGCYAYVVPEHPLAAYQQISTNTLLKYPLALYQQSSAERNFSKLYLEQYGKTEVALVSDKTAFLNSMIAKNVAVGFVSAAAKAYIEKQNPGVFKWLPIKDIPKSEMGLLVPDEAVRHPIVVSCLSCLLP